MSRSRYGRCAAPLMPIGTPVVAASAGVAFLIEESHSDGEIAATGKDNFLSGNTANKPRPASLGVHLQSGHPRFRRLPDNPLHIPEYRSQSAGAGARPVIHGAVVRAGPQTLS